MLLAGCTFVRVGYGMLLSLFLMWADMASRLRAMYQNQRYIMKSQNVQWKDGERRYQRVPAVLLSLCVGSAALALSPAIAVVPQRDAGLFLYMGRAILTGKIPYRDVWDHKLPAIFYIDALGLALVPGTRWGVWLLELLAVMTAALLGFRLLNQAFGWRPALFGSAAWLLTLLLLIISQGGNSTELFALPLQLLALHLFLALQRHDRSAPVAGVLGVTAALIALLRPTLLGVHLVLVLVLCRSLVGSRAWRRLAVVIGAFLAGGIAPLGCAAAYFAYHDALSPLFDQAIHYNSIYAATTIGLRVEAVILGIVGTSFTGLSLIALAGWLGAVIRYQRGRPLGHAAGSLELVALIGLPIELVLVSVSGRVYFHYFIAWLPVMMLLAGFLAHDVEQAALTASARSLRRVGPIILLWLLPLMAGVPMWLLLESVIARSNPTAPYVQTTQQAVAFVSRMTTTGEPILVWGAESAVYVLSDREAPTRFAYQYPLYTRGYAANAHIEIFLREIMARPPTLIIDASGGDALVPPLDAGQRAVWTAPSDSYGLHPALEDVFMYVDAAYERVAILGPQRWLVYRYTGRASWNRSLIP